MKQPSVLVIIPARGGSKRIRDKNIRPFNGMPLITRTVRQAKRIHFADRVIVDTDSASIAKLAKKAGAEVPYLRPQRLATDTSQVVDSIVHMLAFLKRQHYEPDYVLVLQTTSPLRELSDIKACWSLMKKGGVTTVLTVAPTHPRLYALDASRRIRLLNSNRISSTNMQASREAYLLNGCFVYIVKRSTLLKEKSIITKNTKAIVCPKWRSLDLDTPEEWVLAELVHRNKQRIQRTIESFK